MAHLSDTVDILDDPSFIPLHHLPCRPEDTEDPLDSINTLRPLPPPQHHTTEVPSLRLILNLALSMSLKTWLVFLHKVSCPSKGSEWAVGTIKAHIPFSMSDLFHMETKLGSFRQHPFHFIKEFKSLTIAFYLIW